MMEKVLPLKSTAEESPTQEWDVNRYQDQHSFVWKYGASLVDLLEAKPGEFILDIGCGSGELTAAIASEADNKVRVVGMDSDLSMIKRAQDQFPNLSFFQGDVRNFHVPEAGDPVDAIFSNAALHWVPPSDVDRSVASMASVLKKGGRFVVEFGGKGNVQKIVSAVQEVMPDADSPWYFPSVSEYTSVLEKYGIEALSASIFDRPTILEDKDDGIKSWLRMFGNSFFEGKEEGEIDSALDEIQEKLRPQLYDGNKWIADYRRIRVIGRKIT